VILLFDPEYLTAANFRKKRLLEIKMMSPESFPEACSQELYFLNSILTSPLHRQSKSPTLWFHRWWLLNQMLEEPQDSGRLVESEMLAIFKSAERHANNYYAWQHARRLISAFSKPSAHGLADLTGIPDKVKAWCLSNPSDISGWTFLAYILRETMVDTSITCKIIESVMEFVANTGWKKEAVWVFMREIGRDPSILPLIEK
jgi:protein prenyltransferase alpha subunit repeat-containing protein